jgi:hypothetical protein
MGRIWAQVLQTNYCRAGSPGDSHEPGAAAAEDPAPKRFETGMEIHALWELYEIETVDNTYRDSTTLIVHRYEQGV